jgi:hypothetical protein
LMPYTKGNAYTLSIQNNVMAIIHAIFSKRS